ncbi:MAG: molybdopterin adenylyltransferase [Betaproteobacteria bacterium]|nr:molybdopterin adenylyltransferase [Betaproteobacteria bacterium]
MSHEDRNDEPREAAPAPAQPIRLLRIGLISVSDRASQGVYTDRGLPALKEWLERCLIGPRTFETALIPDDLDTIQSTLRKFCDALRCHLVLTTGGTGPARRDVTPEATAGVCTREMPGFGEQMRQISLRFVPTAILSRQFAGLRELPDGHTCLIVNLPGQPKAIAETLEGLRDANGSILVPGVFAAVPYCLDLIGAPFVDTDPAVCAAFRPGKRAS